MTGPPAKWRRFSSWINSERNHLFSSQGKVFDYDDFADFGASGDDEVIDDEDLYRRAHRPAHRPTAAVRITTTTTSTTTARPITAAISFVEDFIVVKDAGKAAVEPAEPVDDGVSTQETFTTAETLVWDWQAGVLVAAVSACLLFFVVAAVYSCQHAWHFRALKKHLDAGERHCHVH